MCLCLMPLQEILFALVQKFNNGNISLARNCLIKSYRNLYC